MNISPTAFFPPTAEVCQKRSKSSRKKSSHFASQRFSVAVVASSMGGIPSFSKKPLFTFSHLLCHEIRMIVVLMPLQGGRRRRRRTAGPKSVTEQRETRLGKRIDKYISENILPEGFPAYLFFKQICPNTSPIFIPAAQLSIFYGQMFLSPRGQGWLFSPFVGVCPCVQSPVF